MEKENNSQDIYKNFDLVKTEIEKAITTYGQQVTLMVHIVSFLVLANATLLGLGFKFQIAIPIFVGGMLPLIIIRTVRRTYKAMKPIAYTAICLESHYGKPGDDYLMTTFISDNVSSHYVEEFIQIGRLEDRATRLRELASVKPPRSTGRFGGPILIVASVFQIVLAILLAVFYGWPMLSCGCSSTI